MNRVDCARFNRAGSARLTEVSEGQEEEKKGQQPRFQERMGPVAIMRIVIGFFAHKFGRVGSHGICVEVGGLIRPES